MTGAVTDIVLTVAVVLSIAFAAIMSFGVWISFFKKYPDTCVVCGVEVAVRPEVIPPVCSKCEITK